MLDETLDQAHAPLFDSDGDGAAAADTPTVLVVGAASEAGRGAVVGLLRRGYRVRALVPEPAEGAAGGEDDAAGALGEHPRLELVRGDLGDANTSTTLLAEAAAGVDRLVVLEPPPSSAGPAAERRLAGLRILTSALQAREERGASSAAAAASGGILGAKPSKGLADLVPKRTVFKRKALQVCTCVRARARACACVCVCV